MEYQAVHIDTTEEVHGKPREYCGGGAHCRNLLHLCRRLKRHGAEALRPLVAEPRFICKVCGRTAPMASLLCKPSAL